jgi:hypothetical protein
MTTTGKKSFRIGQHLLASAFNIRIGLLKHSHPRSIFTSAMLMPKIIYIGVTHAK